MRPIPQRNQLFDLHMHSDRSDGRFSPEEVLERAVEGGLQVVALTDHDLIGAVDPGLHRIGTRDLHVLAGAEISGTHDGREFHLLVYFPGEPPAGFVDFKELMRLLGDVGVMPQTKEEQVKLRRHARVSNEY